MAHRRNGRTAKNYSLLLGSGRVRLAPLYDVASILPYDQCDMLRAKLAMKIGDNISSATPDCANGRNVRANYVKTPMNWSRC